MGLLARVLSTAVAVLLGAGVLGGRDRPRVLAYTTDSDTGYAVIARPDGMPIRVLGPADQAKVSPTGAEVAVVPGTFVHNRRTGPGVVIYPVGAGVGHRYLGAAGLYVSLDGWSPDGRYLVLTASAANATAAGDRLEVIDTLTRTVTVIRRGGVVSGASFAPHDQVIYSWGPRLGANGAVAADLYEENADGTGRRRLTHAGDAVNPLWTRAGVWFDTEVSRGAQEEPAWELSILRGGAATQLSHRREPDTTYGLTPLAASSDGDTVVAGQVGEDTGGAWCVRLRPFRVIALDHDLRAADISADGRSLLVTVGDPEAVPYRPSVGTVACSGRGLHVLGSGVAAGWDA